MFCVTNHSNMADSFVCMRHNLFSLLLYNDIYSQTALLLFFARKFVSLHTSRYSCFSFSHYIIRLLPYSSLDRVKINEEKSIIYSLIPSEQDSLLIKATMVSSVETVYFCIKIIQCIKFSIA